MVINLIVSIYYIFFILLFLTNILYIFFMIMIINLQEFIKIIFSK